MEHAFAHGCSGKLVLRLQKALAQPSFNALDAKDITGTFGNSTRRAVHAVQAARTLPFPGNLDAALWKPIVGQVWPEHFPVALRLLGAFEGRRYTKAAGNYDDAGMTSGIVGFTIVRSELVEDAATKKKVRVYHYNLLRERLLRIFAQVPALAQAAFGAARATSSNRRWRSIPTRCTPS